MSQPTVLKLLHAYSSPYRLKNAVHTRYSTYLYATQQCDHPHNVGGYTASSGRLVTDSSLYTCQHRLNLRCSPCSAIKGSGFVTPSLHDRRLLCSEPKPKKKQIFGFSLKTEPGMKISEL